MSQYLLLSHAVWPHCSVVSCLHAALVACLGRLGIQEYRDSVVRLVEFMKTSMWNDIMELADKLRADEEPFVIATVVAYKSPQSAKPGAKAIIMPDGSISGWIGGGCVQPIVIREAQMVMNTGKPKLVNISPEATDGDWKGVEA